MNFLKLVMVCIFLDLMIWTMSLTYATLGQANGSQGFLILKGQLGIVAGDVNKTSYQYVQDPTKMQGQGTATVQFNLFEWAINTFMLVGSVLSLVAIGLIQVPIIGLVYSTTSIEYFTWIMICLVIAVNNAALILGVLKFLTKGSEQN